MKILPMRDNVLVEPVERTSVKLSSIVIPETARQGAIIEGKVIGKGSKVKLVDVGDEIIFDKHSPTLREVRAGSYADKDSRRFLIMRERDVIARYEKK